MISEQRCHACGHRELLVGQPPSLPSPVCRNCGTQWADPNLPMNKIAKALRAVRRGQISAKGGYFGALNLAADINAKRRRG